jgi:hypothetical protein
MPYIDSAQAIIHFAVDIALKSIVLLGFAALIQLSLRRAAAAMRHAVWLLAMVGALGMPLLTLLLPSLTLSVPDWGSIVPLTPTLAPNEQSIITPPMSKSTRANQAVSNFDEAMVVRDFKVSTEHRPTVDDLATQTPLLAENLERKNASPPLSGTTLTLIAWAIGSDRGIFSGSGAIEASMLDRSSSEHSPDK